MAATVELRTSGTDTARFAGPLNGPDSDDAHWDALLGERQFHIRNYF